MPSVTIAVAAHPLAEGRYLVVASFSAVDGTGATKTRGIAEIWVGPAREGLARIAAEALRELKCSSSVTIALRVPDPTEQPPLAETTAALARATDGHTVTYELAPIGEQHEALEEAERFAAARAAGVITGPDASRAPAPQPKPQRLF